MSIATRTTYLAKCDYPDCHMAYDFWGTSEEDATEDIIDDGEWPKTNWDVGYACSDRH